MSPRSTTDVRLFPKQKVIGSNPIGGTDIIWIAREGFKGGKVVARAATEEALDRMLKGRSLL